MISIEMFVLLILAGIILFSLIKGLLFVALLVLAVAVAYYTGMAGAFIELVSGLLPITSEGPDIALIFITNLFLI